MHNKLNKVHFVCPIILMHFSCLLFVVITQLVVPFV
jgi:hypothetical protein